MLSSCHPAAQVRMRSSWDPPDDRASEEAWTAGPREAGRAGWRARGAGGAGEALRDTVLGSRGHSGMVTTAFRPELLPRPTQRPLSQENPLDRTCLPTHPGGLTAGAAALLEGRRSAPAHAPRLRGRAPPGFHAWARSVLTQSPSTHAGDRGAGSASAGHRSIPLIG